MSFPDEPWRAHPPAPGAARPFRFPPVHAFDLPGGARAYLVEQHALPIVSMQIEVDGGSLVDPRGRDGLAGCAFAMLTEGTRRLDKLAFAEALADRASTISAAAADDTASVSLASLAQHLPATFALFAEMLREPGLRDADFARMIRRRIEGVRQARTAPQSIAARVAGAVLYGRADPFGAVVTEASLRAIALRECGEYLAAWLRPIGARVFAVGDLGEADVRALAGELSWTGAPPPLPALPPPEPRRASVYFVETPGATQAVVWYLQQGPPRDAPDFHATAIAGAVLGGGFASRLNMNLREGKGYSYGASGGFSYTRRGGMLVAQTRVRGDAVAHAIAEIVRELARLRDDGATGDEVAREKAGAILALPARFATAHAALAQYRALVYHRLPLDTYDTFAERIEAVTAADVAAAARAHVRPDHGAFLVVGDGATPQSDGRRLRDALADVGPGALAVLDADGEPASAARS